MASTQPQLTAKYLNESNSAELLAVCVAFLILNIFFFGLRLLSRRYQQARFGWDDALIVVGFVNIIALCIDGIISIKFGSGLHIAKVAMSMPEQIPNWGRNNLYALPIIYTSAATLPKISVLFLYLRLFVDRISRICCFVLIGVLSLFTIVNIITTGVQCNPQAAAWTPALTAAHCADIQAHFVYTGLVNIATDLAMLVLPIPVIRRLQVPMNVKVGIAGTFLVGSLGLVTAIFRFAEFVVTDYAIDGTWQAVPLIIWVTVEASIYFISACLLSCKPLLIKMVNNTRVISMFARLRPTRNSTITGHHDDTIGSMSANSRFDQYHEQPLPMMSMGDHSSEALTRPWDHNRLGPNPPYQLQVEHELTLKTHADNV